MQRDSPTKTGGEWLILAAAVLWGTTGTAQAFAPPGSQPVGVGAIRLAIGGLALLALAIGRGRLRSQTPWPVGVTLLAAVCMAAYQLCFFAAVARHRRGGRDGGRHRQRAGVGRGVGLAVLP